MNAAVDDIDAALSARASVPVSTGDDIGDALTQRATGQTVYKPPAVTGMPDNKDAGPDSAPVQAIHAMASGAGQSIGASGRLISDLFHGKVHSLADASNSVHQYQQENPAYQPETAGGRAITEAVASPVNPLNWPGMIGRGVGKGVAQIADKAGVPSQYTTLLEGGGEAAGNLIPGAMGAATAVSKAGTAIRAGRAATEAAAPTAQEAVNASAAKQSAGAAGLGTDVTNASPPLKQAVVAATQKGMDINSEALTRHVEADSLGIQLTKGQATRDTKQAATEFNNRNEVSQIADRYAEQNQRLIDAVNDVKDRTAPTASIEPVRNGQTVVDAYKQMDGPVKADIKAKYDALTQAAGGQSPLDTGAFLKSVDSELSKQFKTGSLPADIRSQLDALREGRQMSFEDYETLRSDAADAMRTATDGRSRAAASIVRQQLENMPLTPEAQNLKGLADAARNAAKARFDALRADPAYEEAISDGVPLGETSPVADKFLDKYVVRGNLAGVQKLTGNLAGNADAIQAVRGHVLNLLKQRAGIGLDTDTGNFASASFNNTLRDLNPKLGAILDADTLEQVQKIGRVAHDVNFQPRGAAFNNSGTSVAAHASGMIVGHAADMAEGAANVAAKGVPVGSWARGLFKARSKAKFAEDALRPGAGIAKASSD